MFTFCSLQGAQSESSASQSLLELDGGVKVLIDVGWDESFDVAKLKELEKYVVISITAVDVEERIAYRGRQCIADINEDIIKLSILIRLHVLLMPLLMPTYIPFILGKMLMR